MNDRELTSDTMEMVLKSDFSSIEDVVEKTEAFLEARISDDDLVYRVVLLATEAVTNAIEHGNALNPAKQVFYHLAIRQSMIEITVEDEGSGFDPDKTEDPTTPDHLFREGGRGILIMKEMADEVRFENEGRLVRLKFDVR